MTKSFNLDLNLKNACQLEMSTEPLYDKSLCATQTRLDLTKKFLV